jgi:hypothetical protein
VRSTTDRVIFLLLLAILAFVGVRRYAQLRPGRLRLGRAESGRAAEALRASSHLGSRVSSLAGGLHYQLDYWLAACPGGRLATDPGSTGSSQFDPYRTALQEVSREVDALLFKGSLDLIFGQNAPIRNHLNILALWCKTEIERSPPIDCANEQIVVQTSEVRAALDVYQDCLDLIGATPVGYTPQIDSCLARLRENPLRDFDTAPPRELKHDAIASELVLPLGRLRDEDQLPRGPGERFAVSPDGKHLACFLQRAGREIVVVDGEEGPPLDFRWKGASGGSTSLVPTFSFSADSAKSLYAGTQEADTLVVLNGREIFRAPQLVNHLTISPNGQRIAFVTHGADERNHRRIIIDGRESDVTGGVMRLVFSPDSKRVALLGRIEAPGQEPLHVLRPGEIPKRLLAEYWIKFDDAAPDVHEDGYDIDSDSFLFSPDSRRFAYRVEKGRETFVVVDDRPGPNFDEIAAKSVSFSPDSSRFAYAARRGDRWQAVVDGKPGDPYDAVDPPRFSPDSRRVAYRARSGGRTLMIVDGEQRSYDGVDAAYVFGDGSSRLGYLAKISWKWQVVVDGVEEPLQEWVRMGSLVFSPDARRYAYVAGRNKLAFAVVDGEEHNSHQEVGKILFSPDSQRTAYVIKDEREKRVIIDGEAGVPYEEILGQGPIFSFDSRHVAYIGKREHKEIVVLDGNEIGSFFNIDKASLTFSPDSEHIAYGAWIAGVWRIAVGDSLTQHEYAQAVEGAPLTFSSPSRLHLLVRRDEGRSFARLDVDLK